MDSIFFEYPDLLYLELLLVPMLAIYLYRELRRRNPSLTVSSVAPYKFKGNFISKLLRHAPFVLRCIAVAAIVIAIARPRSSSTFEKIDSEGIDIVLAMDISTSMLARDFNPDRIGAAKDIAIQFIAERPSDRIGVVVFAGESFTQAPLTTDRATLINLMKEVECGIIEDGTAIGNGLANAVARLKDSPAKSRVIILLTDGVNNRGEIAPQMAIEIAKTYGIRVYTIGVGAMGEAPYPMMTPYGVKEVNVKVEIDEELLKEIAEATGGEYFRATDNTKLLEIYRQINEMEKSRTTVDSFPLYKEEFAMFALVALAALLIELIVRLFGARRIV
jgi:Ca-activated chloride channel family protein